MRTALLVCLLLCAIALGYAEAVVSVPIIGFGSLVYLTTPLRWQWRTTHLTLAACVWSLASAAPLTVLMLCMLMSQSSGVLIQRLVSRRYQAVLAAFVFAMTYSYFQPLTIRATTVNGLIIQFIMLLIVVRQLPLSYFRSSQKMVRSGRMVPLSPTMTDY